jgi:membrane protease YdiL (CAAX protease family)
MFEKINNNKFFSDSRFLTSVFLIIVCTILFVAFPSGSATQKLTGKIFFLVLVPAAYIKFILKGKLTDFGLNLGNVKNGLFWGAIGLATILLGTYLLINYTNFSRSFQLPSYVVNNFWYFLLYELIFVNILIFCFEFFLRGFVLFTISDKIFYWSIPLQSLLYLFILIYYKNNLEQVAYGITLSLVSGFITYRTRSIVYSYAIILISSLLIDAYLIYSIK